MTSRGPSLLGPLRPRGQRRRAPRVAPGSDYTGRADDTQEHDPSAGTITAGRTGRQQAIAAIITQAVIENGIDYSAGAGP